MEEHEQNSRKAPSLDFTSSVNHRNQKEFSNRNIERCARLQSDKVIATKLPPPSGPSNMIPVKRRWKNYHKTKRRSRESPGFSKQNHTGKKDDGSFKYDASAVLTRTSIPTGMMGKGVDEASTFLTLSLSPDLTKSRSNFLLTYDSEEENEDHHNARDLMRCSSTSPSFPYPQLKATSTHFNEDLHLNPTMTVRTPIAPSLKEYMKEGGTSKYIPRPEWCRTPYTSYLNKLHEHEAHGVRRLGNRMRRRTSSADGVNDTNAIGNVPAGLNVPNVRARNQCAPENGLLTDQSWGEPTTGLNSGSAFLVTDATYIPLYLQHPSRHPNRVTSVAFVDQTANHLQHHGLMDTSSTSYDEESDNISFSQRLQIMSSSEDDTSVFLQPITQRYPSQEDSTLHHTALKESKSAAYTFGKECSSALHICIENNATRAAIELTRFGAPVNFPNIKGLTPIILASEKGNLDVVRILLERGANPGAVTTTGSTALIKASHFGHDLVVEFLLRHGAMAGQANYKHTTALMRAAQEGHKENVKLLLRYDRRVNRENHEKMTALMLAAQRGHATIAKILIRAGAKINVKTTQDSTSLMLACKRGHAEIAQVLIAAGSELMFRDNRGRTARESAIRKGLLSLMDYITPQAQISLMKHDAMVERRHFMLMMWKLLQQERASVNVFAISSESGKRRGSKTIHELSGNLHDPLLECMNTSRRALVLSMMLPMPLLGVISSYLPAPRLWEKRLEMLTRRSHINTDCTISCALDLIDEVLEEGGFVEACDSSGIIPPANFETWAEWKANSKCGNMAASETRPHNAETNAIVKQIVNSKDKLNLFIGYECMVLRLRRDASFLQLLAHRSPLLATTLLSPPYQIPSVIIQKLKDNSDIQSLVRRLGSRGVHFDVSVATELVFLASQLLLWYHSSNQGIGVNGFRK